MQEKTKKQTYHFQMSENLSVRYMDLISEVGELGKEILKGTNYGEKDFSAGENLELELGDCLFALLSICNICHVDAETALNRTFEKLERRLQATGSIGSGY